MKIVIIGNGISGITAARWARKLSDHEITVISSETKYFYSRTALMYIYMGHMRHEDTKPYEDWFWSKNRIDLVEDHVLSVDFDQKYLDLKSEKKIKYDKLVFALGSKPNKYGWPGQDLNGVGGLYHLQDLDRMESFSKNLNRAVIVGGGLIGIEMAEMFRSRNIDVTMLVRESSYWSNVLPIEESQMVSKHIQNHHIDIRFGSNLKKINDNGNGNVASVTIKETNETINCGFVGLTAGVSPNVAFLKNTSLNIDKGIVVNNYLETNIHDVYAIGDCAQLDSPHAGRRNLEAVWYTGRMMGETVAYNMCDKKIAYNPGIWFNSAKFFDIEYQVYGDIRSCMPDNHESILWSNMDLNKSIRINYDKVNKNVVGFNLMGVRYRHEVCEKWIQNKTHIEEVLQKLSLANFDPEFYKQYEQDIISVYNSQSGQNLKLKSKRSLNQVISFLKGKV